MPVYSYPTNDGKIHTRYSELVRCTPGQIDAVIFERFDPESRFQNTFTRQGTERHEEFKQESLQTGFTPLCFDECLGGALPIVDMEHTINNELWEGIILWSTPDQWGYIPDNERGYIVDFKTAKWNEATPRKLKRSDIRQMVIYSLQAQIATGLKLNRGCLLTENWLTDSKDRFWKVKNREAFWFDITDEMREEELLWMEPRVQLLISGLEARKQLLQEAYYVL